MKIESSDFTLQTQHDLLSAHEKKERLLAWTGEQPKNDPTVEVNLSPDAREQLANGDTSALPAHARAVATDGHPGKHIGTYGPHMNGLAKGHFKDGNMKGLEPELLGVKKTAKANAAEPYTKLSPMQDLEMKIVESMLSRLMGKKVKLVPTVRLDAQALSEEQTAIEGELNAAISQKQAPQSPVQSVGWGIAYDYEETHYESESMSFQAKGLVTTADGREISVDAELHMSREFYSHSSFSFRAGDAVFMDPLVLNYDGKGVDLEDKKFEFDLDADGKPDQISQLAEGNAFLVLDKNQDGEINDGSELFGPTTGDGFGELAEHDVDQNGWIDENDDVFENLRVWITDDNGDKRLVSLGEAGVGAIYLGTEDTEFSLTNDVNEAQGQLRETGIYLNEDGSAGFIQEIDLRKD